ncbi:biopolymer transporter ExbD [Leptolyngbya sp. FACHB-261]|nr:biopolymer transporter ExbD [Leptolyngbya sp. FACHB-261]
MPVINLVPLLDVTLTVLTFFVLASLSLTRQPVLNVNLPSTQAGVSQQEMADPLVIGLNPGNQILLKNRPVDSAQMAQAIQSYLGQNPKGTVVLQADRTLAYQEVVQLLGEMRAVGGDRVSLALEQN